jgi:hypothetical protein
MVAFGSNQKIGIAVHHVERAHNYARNDRGLRFLPERAYPCELSTCGTIFRSRPFQANHCTFSVSQSAQCRLYGQTIAALLVEWSTIRIAEQPITKFCTK